MYTCTTSLYLYIYIYIYVIVSAVFPTVVCKRGTLRLAAYSALRIGKHVRLSTRYSAAYSAVL